MTHLYKLVVAVGLVIRNGGTFLRPTSLNRRVSVSLSTGEIQGAYKLSEDFAKPYFHKY